MRTWFVPPIVIPIVIVMGFVIALAWRGDPMSDGTSRASIAPAEAL
jgi:hypothetical protein